MLHFLAFAWDAPRIEPRPGPIATFLQNALNGHSRWRIVARLPGIAVCVQLTGTHNAYRVYELPAGHGVILGRLFDRSYQSGNVPREISFDEIAARKLSAEGGRGLVTSCWGHYVAFLCDATRSTAYVLRDPTGGIPCVRARAPGAYVYASRPEDCLPFLGKTPSVNFNFLAGRIAFDAASRRETGLCEVHSVLGGERIEHGPRGVRKLLCWDAFRIAEDELELTRSETVRLFRETTEACVHAWSSCYPGIVHCLSGGLDSAVLLACLLSAPTRPHVTCFNQYSRGSDTDERGFARLAAARTPFDLVEKERRPNFSLERLRRVPRMPTPFTFCTALQADQQEFELARERSAHAVFTGSSGDELFYQGGPLPPSTDYAHSHGVGGRFFSIAMDDAYASRISIWRVLKLAALHGLLKRPYSVRDLYRKRARPLVPAQIRNAALQDPGMLHPLLDHAPALPPGKLIQTYVLLLPTLRPHNPLLPEDCAQPLSPLFSQPLIELSLRTPLHVLASDGRDRSIARDAFRGDMPREIFIRRTKGGIEEFIKAIISHNLGLIRELLLDGLLVRHGYLERRLLHEVLAGDPTRVRSYAIEIFGYLDTEAWLRSWSTERQLQGA